jgi:hypothetical protein
LEFVSLLADSFNALAVLLDESDWASLDLAFSVDESGSLGANDLVASVLLQDLSVRAGSSDAFSILLNKVWWAAHQKALSIDLIESWWAVLGNTRSFVGDLVLWTISTILDAFSVNEGVSLLAAVHNTSNSLVALSVLQNVSFWASGNNTLSELGIELLVLSTLDTGSVMEGPSRLARLLNTGSVLENKS